MLDAQRSVYAAEDQLVQSEKNGIVTLIAVFKTLGGGWSVDEVPPPSQVSKAWSDVSRR